MNATSWLETYRGMVYRWEVDPVDHFTVAFYFARFEDATLALLHAIGLDPDALARAGATAVTTECNVRYRRELRVGDILHIRSGVTAADDDGIRVAHEVIDSGDGALCTSVDQTIALIEAASRKRRPLTPAQRQAALVRRVEPETAPEGSATAHPETDAGFIDSAADAIKPSEVNTASEAGFAAYIHRFTASNSQVLGAFGLTPDYCRREHRGFSTFEFRLRFLGTLRAGDLVRVRTGLLHVGNSSIRILHRLTNARTGELVCTLEQAGVNLDLDARRPSPIPPDMRERALALLVSRR
jgi:acyl-CoA thioester hydrolase